MSEFLLKIDWPLSVIIITIVIGIFYTINNTIDNNHSTLLQTYGEENFSLRNENLRIKEQVKREVNMKLEPRGTNSNAST